MNNKVDIVNSPNIVVEHYKLPYIVHISTDVQHKFNMFCKFYYKYFNIRIVLSLFKVGDTFNMKDLIANSMRSFVVYKFACSGCNAYYIGETTRHLTTRIKKYLELDKKSLIFAYLLYNENSNALRVLKFFGNYCLPSLLYLD